MKKRRQLLIADITMWEERNKRLNDQLEVLLNKEKKQIREMIKTAGKPKQQPKQQPSDNTSITSISTRPNSTKNSTKNSTRAASARNNSQTSKTLKPAVPSHVVSKQSAKTLTLSRNVQGLPPKLSKLSKEEKVDKSVQFVEK